MAKPKLSVGDVLEKAREASKPSYQLDAWFDEDPKRMKDLVEGVEWFRENRGPKFGWLAFYETMKTLDGWSDIPVQVRAFHDYVIRFSDSAGSFDDDEG